MNRSPKWTAEAIAEYKQMGEHLKELGYKAIREIVDMDCESVLTFWGSSEGTIIQQTWYRTADICLYGHIPQDEWDGMLSTAKGGEETR